MIAALEAAICESLGTLSGVATARPYAGELADTRMLSNQRVALRVPALLVTLTKLSVEPDPGTGEVLARAHWSVIVCTRQAQGAEARGSEGWEIAQAVLVAVRFNTWDVPGVSPAELVGVEPIWDLEPVALALRVVSWTQLVRLGEPDAVAGIAPSEIWLGVAPRIGAAHVDDYWRIDEPPEVTP